MGCRSNTVRWINTIKYTDLRSAALAIDAPPVVGTSYGLYRQQVAVLILHRGWVKTDMGGYNAPLPVEESIKGMRHVIESFDLENSGSFLNFKGQLLPW